MCPKKLCKTCARGIPDRSPKICAKRCAGASENGAEIVRNLRGGAAAQFARNIGVGLPRMCVHKFSRIFSQKLEFFPETKMYGQKMSQA